MFVKQIVQVPPVICDVIFLFANFALDKMAQFKKEAEQRKAEQEAKTRYWINICPPPKPILNTINDKKHKQNHFLVHNNQINLIRLWIYSSKISYTISNNIYLRSPFSFLSDYPKLYPKLWLCKTWLIIWPCEMFCKCFANT